MLFKGTTSRAPGVIASQVQDAGGYINAYTSNDRTVYWIDVPAKGAGKAVDILADAMMNATLPEVEYNKEQEVIRREFAMGYDNPDRTASLLLFPLPWMEAYRLDAASIGPAIAKKVAIVSSSSSVNILESVILLISCSTPTTCSSAFIGMHRIAFVR